MADSFPILSYLLLANYPSSTWQIDSWYSNPQKSPRVLHNVHCSSQSLGSQHALSNAHRKSLQRVGHAAKLWNKKWDCVYSFQLHSKIKKQQPFLTPLPLPGCSAHPRWKATSQYSRWTSSAGTVTMDRLGYNSKHFAVLWHVYRLPCTSTVAVTEMCAFTCNCPCCGA